MASAAIQAQANALNAKMEGEASKMLDDVERNWMRRVARQSFVCAVKCYDKAGTSGPAESLESCTRNCQAPYQQSSNLVQQVRTTKTPQRLTVVSVVVDCIQNEKIIPVIFGFVHDDWKDQTWWQCKIGKIHPLQEGYFHFFFHTRRISWFRFACARTCSTNVSNEKIVSQLIVFFSSLLWNTIQTFSGSGAVSKSIESKYARMPRKGSGHAHTRHGKWFVRNVKGREGFDLVHGIASERTHQIAKADEGKVRFDSSTVVS